MVGRLVAYISWQTLWLDPRAVHAGYVVDKLTEGKVYVYEFRFCFLLYHPTETQNVITPILEPLYIPQMLNTYCPNNKCT
jgi:hypothetical protein